MPQRKKTSRRRILVVDDHSVVRRGIKTLLETQPTWRVCGEAASGDEALLQASKRMGKLKLSSFSELARFTIREGLVDSEEPRPSALQ